MTEFIWFDWSIDTWPLLMALLVGLGCGLLGAVFLVRRAALLGDAVSHSVLPGIAGGILLSGLLGAGGGEVFSASRTLAWVLGGALAAGLLSTALIEALFRHSRLKSDTALGAVFPAFFAAGVILIEVVAQDAHLDTDCIFYGALELIDGFPDVAPTLAATTLVILFLALFYKEVQISSFDASLARALGMRVGLVNACLVALLTATVVSAFEAVGAILVIAFLIIPPATAYLIFDRLHHVMGASAVIGMSSGFLGCWLTVVLEGLPMPGADGGGFETARAPTMAIVAGLLFLAAFLFTPRRGLVAQRRKQRALARRIQEENLLGAIYRLSLAGTPAESAGGERAVSVDRAADALGYPLPQLRPALSRVTARGEVSDHGDGSVTLTDEGRRRIESVLRAHRLWESYMMTRMGAAPDHVHDAADQIEHYLRPGLVEDLYAELDRPRLDPHGKTIPASPETGSDRLPGAEP